MLKKRPKFQASVRNEVDLYSIDQLRTKYHAAQGSYNTPIRLRNENVSREQVVAEIRWRIHREECRFWLLTMIAFVAALAGCTSTVVAYLAFAKSFCG